MAAPPKYNPDWHDDWAWSLALQGATDEEVAKAFKVSKRTIIRWKEEHESFAEAYQRGKDIADAKVEKSLYQRAIGYETKDTEKIVELDPKTGDPKPVRVKTVTKQIAPDTMAAMYWLNNRKPDVYGPRKKEEDKKSDVVDDWIAAIPDYKPPAKEGDKK